MKMFPLSFKNNKIRGITLTEEVEDSYTKNWKTLEDDMSADSKNQRFWNGGQYPPHWSIDTIIHQKASWFLSKWQDNPKIPVEL